MKFLSKNECLESIVQRGVNVNERGRPADRGPYGPIPTEAGKRVLLVKSIFSNVAEDNRSLLYFPEWGVWSFGEHQPVFYSIRESLGETRSLMEIPGQMADSPNDQNLLSLLVVGVLFLWDAWLVAEDGAKSAYFSHDEIVDIYGFTLPGMKQ